MLRGMRTEYGGRTSASSRRGQRGRHLSLGITLCAGVSFAAGCADPGDSGDPLDAAPSVASAPPQLQDPGPQQVDEEQTLELAIVASDPNNDPLRLFVSGLPEGARFDEATRRLRFTPDSTQGGRSWPITVTASDGTARTRVTFTVTARDTIRPPAPQITKTETVGAWKRLTVSQKTDAFLDSPGYAGRELSAIVTVPLSTDGPPRLPVRVSLHGFGGGPSREGWEGELRIYPHDPMNTYWWGYSERLPGSAPGGAVPPYTQRRVLHLLEWALRSFPIADPERVYLEGGSMGGAGAMELGLLSARHFCWVRASLGQAIPRNHRPSRISQLTGLWGSPQQDLASPLGLGVWDARDQTRLLSTSAEARDQFLTLKHGKDDSTIHFGAVVMQSALTGRSLYATLQEQHTGHFVIWDEGGHGPADPVLGDRWWESGWDPVFDDTTFLRRNLAFPGFSGCSTDRDPGTGRGNGKRTWDPEAGFAAKLEVAGDTGWDGEIAGARNRGLRWDARRIVDTEDTLELPLKVLDGAGGAPPRPGYPTKGDKLDGALPVRVAVTPRRLQRFQLLPGELVRFTIGAQAGSVRADASGAVTVPAVELSTEWRTLTLTRAPDPR